MNDNPRGTLEYSMLEEFPRLVGVDEVGRGCLAGPVFAACVALDYRQLLGLTDAQKDLIRDSKRLSSKQREAVIPLIKQISHESYIAHATVAEIEELGIVDATFLAMRRALSFCERSIDVVLIDGNMKIRNYTGRQVCVVGGDNSCYAIAAASIIAKEARDKFMRKMGDKYPQYGFSQHVGYGTAKHMEALREFGACELHRRNFAPVKRVLTAEGMAIS